MLCEPHFVQKCALRMEVCVCRNHDFLPPFIKRELAQTFAVQEQPTPQSQPASAKLGNPFGARSF